MEPSILSESLEPTFKSLQSQALLFRGIERLLIVIAASMAMWFGYNLFIKGIDKDQKGQLTGNGWKVKMQSVGPGVFFALFGSVVLIMMSGAQLTFETPFGGKQIGDQNGQEEDTPNVASLGFFGGVNGEDLSAIELLSRNMDLLQQVNRRTQSVSGIDNNHRNFAAFGVEEWRATALMMHFKLADQETGFALLKAARGRSSSFTNEVIISEVKSKWLNIITQQ